LDHEQVTAAIFLFGAITASFLFLSNIEQISRPCTLHAKKSDHEKTKKHRL